MAEFIGALDQGTTSTRFIVFDHDGEVVAVDQREHRQIFPEPGWVEHDPAEIWSMATAVISGCLAKAHLKPSDLAGVGITNQRETTVIWDARTGEPVANAVVWQDTRTARICDELTAEGGIDRFRPRTGLPVATYFSGPKARWLLDHHGLRERGERGELLLGTIDSWLTWNLTDHLHVTDTTNASRSLLMDLGTRQWDADLALEIGVPATMLPEIVDSVGRIGDCTGPLDGVPLGAIFGDQHAALFGQVCFEPGEAKNTYGTGNFMLMNTGSEPVSSMAGLLTTIAYTGVGPAQYALEGSVAVTGSLVQWLRDNLGLFEEAGDIEELASSVEDNGDVYFVPAFSGLFAPYWRPDARGTIVGLTRFSNKGHIARSALEATAYQTSDVLTAMIEDSGVQLKELRVDGGMTANALLMQFQADILGVEVVRPRVSETTALGAAYGAGLAVGFWESTEELRRLWAEDRRWSPDLDVVARDHLLERWHGAINRSYGWV
ncbi:MAG: glycerol kinase GlpK [Acidimicrobiia bacterium]|nr:glycerol kinase GlpK [Acidimicrobiia bacterium]